MRTGELIIYEDIGENFYGVSARTVLSALHDLGDVDIVNVRLNSGGGDVFEGQTIYQALRRHRAAIHVDIDGAAASIASLVAMAADPGQLRIAPGGALMLHRPWSVIVGNADDMRHRADLLETIQNKVATTYAERTGLEVDAIEALMDAETWYFGSEAVEAGFADELSEVSGVAAHVNPQLCRHIPAELELALADQARRARERVDKRLRKSV